ncbi:MAG TPA: hypothetical protein VH370_19940 [Humisphaera sp.]|jgi:hypothetical protein|nr:hypothetical protein [Humisphaera sp.]
MRTNYLLLAAVLLILGVWGAAQFGSVDAQYYWGETPGPPWEKDYNRGVRVECERDSIEVEILACKLPMPPEYPHLYLNVVGWRIFRPRLVKMPGWLAITLPYWLLALPPAAWLAWRLYRARTAPGGFPVAGVA